MTAASTKTAIDSLISVKDVEFAYSGSDYRLVIDSFQVAPGEAVALIGPSGAGKTTLLHLIAGLLSPATGTVEIAGRALAALSPAHRRDLRAQKIGFVFQNFELLDYLSGWQNVLYGHRLSSKLKITPAVKARARDLAASVGLTEAHLKRNPAKLSGGEKQRIAICRALLGRPELILADEATGNLDPENKSLIAELLLDRARKEGAGVIAVTHDRDLLPMFDRVVDFESFRKRKAAP